MKRLKRIIGRTFASARHPWRALWRWGMRPDGPKARQRRFKAAMSWARDHQIAAQHDHDKRRAHKFWLARRIYRKKFRRLRRRTHKKPPPQVHGNFTVVDGRMVPNWMVPKIKEIRARGRWSGVVVSGFRTPEECERLCFAMCGHPTCPGRCAGRSSNHCCPPSFRGVAYEGAIDVSDYWTFAAEARAVGAPFYNALPADPVHFSHSGR